MLDIFSVVGNKVSKEFKTYCNLFYGPPKSGKTSVASKFPKHLVLAFEIGYKAIPNIMALPVGSWGDALKIKKQLSSDKAKDTYENLVIDTFDIMFSEVEKYVCAREGVSNISDVPFGGGYSMVKKEITSFLHGLQKEGYGVHLISHAKEAGEEGAKYWTPSLTATAAKVGMGFVDQIIFIDTTNPQQREACFRYDGNGMPFVAGSRFQHIVNRVPLGFDNIMSAMSDAIDALGDDNLVDSIQMNEFYKEESIPEFEENMKNINEIISAIMKDPSAANKTAITAIIEKHLGVGKKIGDANRLQNQFCYLILLDLQEHYQSNCKQPKED